MPHDRKPPEKTVPLPLPPAFLRTHKKVPETDVSGTFLMQRQRF